MAPVRKSGRAKKPKKYTNDPFEGLDILSSDSESKTPVVTKDDVADRDADFELEHQNQEDHLDEEEAFEDGQADRASVSTPAEDGSDFAADDVPDGGQDSREGSLFAGTQTGDAVDARLLRGQHARGVPTSDMNDAKADYLKYLFGTGEKDLVAHVRSRDKWAFDPTLPSKTVKAQGQGGFGPSFAVPDERRQREATVGWDWYYKRGGREKFEENQVMHPLTEEEGSRYLVRDGKVRRFLAGRDAKGGPYSLATGEFMNLGELWKESSTTAQPPASEAKKPTKSSTAKSNTESSRDAWLVNMGNKVLCIDWAPNQDGETQYLALSTSPLKDEGVIDPTKPAPAFTPHPPTPSAIQIWAFKSTLSENGMRELDVEEKPQLQLALCSEWGQVRRLSWCPVSRVWRDEDGKDGKRLGLLAGIWADGKVRVLDVRMERDATSARYGNAFELSFALLG